MGQKYGTYGSKLWELRVKSMALLVRKYGSLGFALASQYYGQRSTDNGPLGGSRL